MRQYWVYWLIGRMKMRVLGYDPYLSEENAKRLGIEKVDLDELLGRADFITIIHPDRCYTKYHQR